MSVMFVTRLKKIKENKEGKLPVVLQITFNRKVRQKYTGIWVKPYQFEIDDEGNGFIKNVNLIEEKRRILKDYLKWSKRILEDHFEERPFDYKKFSQLLDEKITEPEIVAPEKIKVAQFSFEHSKKLLSRDKIRSSNDYKQLGSTILNITPKDLYFDDFDLHWLAKVVKYYDDRNTNGGNSMVLLRALYNHAIKARIVDFRNNPFKNNYTNPYGFDVNEFRKRMPARANENRRKDLTKEELNQLNEYIPMSEKEQEYFDIWWMSYYTFGVNTTDLAFMKYKDIKNGRWFYERNKTGGKLAKGKVLLPEALAIIEKYKTKYPNSDYVLPILDDEIHITVKDKYNRARDIAGHIRKMGVRISKRLGWDFYFTAISTRHTSTTIALNSGVDSRTTSHLLDHKNFTTINKYVGRADDKKTTEAMEVLRL